MLKKSYFQGTEEPKPKKQQYKPEKRIVDQSRFKEPFYKNYDLYDVPGEHGPGAGWSSIQNYKSIQEFLKARRKKMKDKYKADDSWIEEDGKISKKRAERRKELLSIFVKTAIDFPIDEQISNPILGDSGTYSDSVPIGGAGDEYLPNYDFGGKSPEQLNFGRDYEEEAKNARLEKLLNKYVSEPDLYGLPDGILPKEDLDHPSDEGTEYGTLDSGSTMYDKMWI